VDRLDATIDALTSAAREAEDELGATEQSARAEAEAVLLECDAELSACRAALRQGADAGVVADWISETQTRRLKAQQTLAKLGSARPSHSVSREEIVRLIDSLGDMVQTIRAAAPSKKAEVYSRLDLTLIYDPANRTVVAECGPDGAACGKRTCRRGDLNPHALAGTSPSSWRVCLFRHSDVELRF
jgi:hypothetical protein